MHLVLTQTSEAGRLRFICFRADRFHVGALTLLTKHILDRVDFSAVTAMPGGRTETREEVLLLLYQFVSTEYTSMHIDLVLLVVIVGLSSN